MNGYKTGGDWADVTSIDRNEVVFEGRHKAYGAFYIRQRYSNVLLFAWLSAITFIGLGGLTAYALRSVRQLDNIPEKAVAAKPDIFIMPPVIHPPVPPHPIVKPSVQPPKATPNNSAPPVITNLVVDTATTKPKDVPILTTPHVTPGTVTNEPGLPPAVAPNGTLESPDNTPQRWVSEMPKFPGDIREYLAKNTMYSAEERQLEVQGTVYVAFIIERDGSVSNVNVERGIADGPDLNKEAVRVLAAMPKWTPGKQDGHPVRVQYVIPIHFKLQ